VVARAPLAARASSKESGKGAAGPLAFVDDSPPPLQLASAPPLRLSVPLLKPPLTLSRPSPDAANPPLSASTDDGGRRLPALSPSKLSTAACGPALRATA